MSKRVLITALAGINLLLFVGLVLGIHRPRDAVAQMAADAGATDDYLVIAAEVELNNDAVYIIDAQNEFLHVFRTPFPRSLGIPIRLTHIDSRDLSQEFRREAPVQ